MPLDPALAGRSFAPTSPYLVSRERIAEFALALGAELLDSENTAPLTFPITIAFDAMTHLMSAPDVGIELHNVIHGEQRFEYNRPVRAGDELVAQLSVDRVRSAAGMDMIDTRTEISTTGGEQVCRAFALLLHRGDEP